MAEATSGKASWSDINRVLLPRLELTAGTLNLPPGRNVAVLGPHRSGTTWLANLLADSLVADRPFEKDCARMLLGTSPATAASRRVLQGTFLMPCPRLGADLAARCFAIAIVRDPVAVVRSMVHNWLGLADSAALVEAVHGLTLPSGPVDRATAVLEVSMRQLSRHLSNGLIDAAVTYDHVIGATDPFISDIASALHLDARPTSERDPSNAPHDQHAHPSYLNLSDFEEERVRQKLGSLYVELTEAIGQSRLPRAAGD